MFEQRKNAVVLLELAGLTVSKPGCERDSAPQQSTTVSESLTIVSIKKGEHGELQLFPKDWGLYRYLSFTPNPDDHEAQRAGQVLQAAESTVCWLNWDTGRLPKSIEVQVTRVAQPKVLDVWYGTEKYRVYSLAILAQP